MSTGKLLLYAVAGVLLFVVVSTAISMVLAAISFIWFMIRALAVLFVLGGLGYVGYRAYSLLSGGSSETATTRTSSTATGEFSLGDSGGVSTGGGSRVDELRRQYLDGEITEEEFERKVERELDTDEFDSIDRELQRERI